LIQVADILLDSTDDLIIAIGDFAIGNSDEIHVEQILKSAKTEFKNFPLLGVHLNKKTLMPTSETQLVSLKKNIKIQLEYDNYRVNKIDVSNLNQTIINCERIR
jgi:hypothetical protein